MTATEGKIGTSVETEVVFACEGKTIWQRYNKGQSRQRTTIKATKSQTPCFSNSRFLIEDLTK